MTVELGSEAFGVWDDFAVLSHLVPLSREADSSSGGADQSFVRRLRSSRSRDSVAAIAAWAGLANMVYVLCSIIVRQWSTLPDETGGADPLGRARDTAITGAIVGILALLSGRLHWPSVALAGLLGLWAAAETLSALALHDQVIARPLLLALTGIGLALGVSVAKPVLTGWSIFLIGCAYTYANLYVLWTNYRTLGTEFQGSAYWWGPERWAFSVIERPRSAPDPSDVGYTIWKLAEGKIQEFSFEGLGSNSGLTGNFAAFLIVFTVPFVLGRWKASSHPKRTALARAAMIVASALPGVFLLVVLDARSPLAGVLLGWGALVVPLEWSRNRRYATLAAILVPTATLVPVLMARWGLLSATGRDCVWSSWRIAIRDSPVWGGGPTDGFPGVACGSPWWYHAHNELLQAWWVSGIVGLLAVAGFLALLGWFAVRFSERDQRTLLSAVLCAAVLLSFEVITSHQWDWIGPGLAALVAVSARSLRLMADGGETLRSASLRFDSG